MPACAERAATYTSAWPGAPTSLCSQPFGNHLLPAEKNRPARDSV